METQVLDASTRGSIEGVILRYGMFYGLEAASTVAMIEMVRKRMLPVIRGERAGCRSSIWTTRCRRPFSRSPPRPPAPYMTSSTIGP